jgi:release factor glutamine methyltransferase
MTAAELLAASAPRLAAAGVPEARREARLLLRACAGADPWLDPDVPVDRRAEAAFHAAVARRAAREPFAYIVGRRAFRGLDLAVDGRVLVPRPETEALVEEGARLLPRGGSALDLCTGSGAVALALAAERPDARVTATDLSADALAVARDNADRLGLGPRVRLLRGDLWDALPPGDPGFELCTCNPPYVEAGELPGLQPEVRDWEPSGALVAPEGWRALYGRIVLGAPAHLRPGGWLLCEASPAQTATVAALFAPPAWESAAVLADLGGLPRVVRARRARP